MLSTVSRRYLIKPCDLGHFQVWQSDPKSRKGSWDCTSGLLVSNKKARHHITRHVYEKDAPIHKVIGNLQEVLLVGELDGGVACKVHLRHPHNTCEFYL